MFCLVSAGSLSTPHCDFELNNYILIKINPCTNIREMFYN